MDTWAAVRTPTAVMNCVNLVLQTLVGSRPLTRCPALGSIKA
jgi:hypothetical protein